MKQKHYIIAAVILLLTAAVLGWRYWRLNELRSTIRQEFSGSVREEYREPLFGFVEKLRQGDSLQAAQQVMDNLQSFDQIFFLLAGKASQFRRQGQPDAAATQMNAAAAIAAVFHRQCGYDFLERQWAFYQGLRDDQLADKLAADSLMLEGYRVQDDETAKLRFHQQSIDHARLIGDRKREVDNLSALQFYMYKNDKNPASLDYGRQALALAEQIGYLYRAQKILNILGSSATELGDNKQALEYLEQGLSLARRLQDQDARIDLLSRIGIVHYKMGSYGEALQAHTEVITLSQTSENHSLERKTSIERAIVYTRLGEYDHAETDYNRALELVEDSTDKAITLVNLGDLHSVLGLYDLAMKELQQAYQLYREAKRYYSAATSLINIATIWQNREEYRRALENLRLARTMIRRAVEEGAVRSKELESEILVRIGDLYAIDHNWERSLAVYDSALNNYRRYQIPEGIAAALNRLGNAHREMQDYAGAAVYLRQAGAIADTLSNPRLSAEVAYRFGLLYRDRKDPVRAKENLERAIRILDATTENIESDASINYFATLQAPYEAMILLKQQQGQFAEAFHYTEQSRARALRKLLSDSGGAHEAPPLPSLADIQAGLSADLQLIEFKVTEQRLLTFLVGRDRFELFETPVSRNELRNLVQRFRETLGAVDNPAFEAARAQDPRAAYERTLAAAAKLTARLITPIAGKLDSSKTLCIVPDDMLFYVPFAALASPLAGERFLVEDFPVVTAPSAAIMAYTLSSAPLRPDARRELQLFAAANPDGQLQKAAAEVRQIAGFFSRADTLIGHRLSETAVRQALQPAPQIGHFATHANTNVGNPRLAYLEVGIPYSRTLADAPATRSAAGSRSDDEILTAGEIRGLNLKGTAFVCLSACQTAGGRFFAGEGMVGLTTAFVEAGVPAVMSTLWDVYDDYTAQLMVRFYRHWIAGGRSKARALQQAQIEVIELLREDEQFAYPHPHRWSGFVLTGDGR